MQKVYFKSTKNEDFSEIPKPKKGSWIDVFDADHDEIDALAEFLDLNYEDLRDALDVFEVPRIERKKDKAIFFVRYPNHTTSELYTHTLCIVLTPELVITISKNHNNLLKRIKKYESDLNTTQPVKFLMKILHEITREYTNQISGLIRKVSMGRRNHKNIDDKDIAILGEQEEVLNQYLSALIPMQNVLDTITTTEFIRIHDNDQDLLNDLVISVNQSVDLCRVNLRAIQSLRNSHQIYFTNRLNKTIQILTVFTIIMSVPTIISSIFGMNVGLPFQNHPAGFPIIIVISFISSALTYILLKVKGWV